MGAGTAEKAKQRRLSKRHIDAQKRAQLTAKRSNPRKKMMQEAETWADAGWIGGAENVLLEVQHPRGEPAAQMPIGIAF